MADYKAIAMGQVLPLGCDAGRLLQTIVGLCRVVFLCLFADGAVFFDCFNVFVRSLMIKMQHDG